MKKAKIIVLWMTVIGILASSVFAVFGASCSHSCVKDYYKKTVYKQIAGDNESHTLIHIFERKCDTCSKIINSEVYGNPEKETHTFSGNVCTKCEYVKSTSCLHKECKDYYTESLIEPVKGDNVNHRIINYYTKKCESCGAVRGTDIKGETKTEAHSFSGNVCTVCGYVRKEEACKHTSIKKTLSDTEYSLIKGDAQYHHKMDMYTQSCADCGKILKENVKGNKEKSNHIFEGLKCQMCGYTKKAAEETSKNNDAIFADVRSDDKYYKALEYLYKKNIIAGKSDNEFDPDGNLTRAEAATIICKMMSQKSYPKVNSGFNDVPKSHWASGYIKEARDLSIISGKGNNEFDPGGSLTGFEFVKMLVCYLGYGDEVIMEYADSAWPNGYYYYGRDKLKLLKNAPTENYNLPIKRSDAVVLAYNSLHTTKSKTIMSKKYTSMEEWDKVTAFNGEKITGDEDGLSCALYAPVGSRGIQTHVDISDVELQLHDGDNNDKDNAYIYVCINSYSMNGDFGLLWHGNEDVVSVVCSADKPIGWQVEEIPELKNCEDIQLELVWKKNGTMVQEGEGLYFAVYADGKCVYEKPVPFNGDFSNSIFGRVASMTNSIVNNWSKDEENNAGSQEEKEEIRKNREILEANEKGNYLHIISSKEFDNLPTELKFVLDKRTNNSREPAKFKNIKFFDTYYHSSYGSVHSLTIGNEATENKGELWIYPNKKLNCNNIYTRGQNNPIVTCKEYVENGKIVNEISFENY